SDAGNLVPNQAGPTPNANVFLYSRATGQNQLVSASGGSGTTAGNYGSGGPVLSAQGNWLVFPSQAYNLVAQDLNGSADVFAYTPGSPGLALLSRADHQDERAGNSYATSVSADGRFTVFTSTATNLVANQVTANTNQNVFLFDKQTGTT